MVFPKQKKKRGKIRKDRLLWGVKKSRSFLTLDGLLLNLCHCPKVLHNQPSSLFFIWTELTVRQWKMEITGKGRP